jgi:hypothetical protein
MTQNVLVGSWKMVSYEVAFEDGEVIYPLGQDALGCLIYTEKGYMSVNIMTANRHPFVSEDFTQASIAEKVAAFETFIAYSGQYEILNNQVIHYADIASVPNWIGIGHERFFQITGNQLLLSTNPIKRGDRLATYRVVWERV